MQSIKRSDLSELILAGRGVVLVDKHSRDHGLKSTLHGVQCTWLRSVGPVTPLRFAESTQSAVRWLLHNYGAIDGAWAPCRQCGGLAVHAQSTNTNPRNVGETIWVSDRGMDRAYVTTVLADEVDVAEFDFPTAPAVAIRRVPVSQTGRFRPSAGEPCWVYRDGQWHLAQVLSAKPEAASIPVLIDGKAKSVAPESIRFRHLQPLIDPAGALAAPTLGNRDRVEARRRFLDTYCRFAAPARGMTGISSAAVELHAHQVGVARRVLADPVQRYLLADEVGLGKTIEAGFIIRQRLIDAPRSNILVLVPQSLIWQWEYELDSKFRILELRRGGINVHSYEDERGLRQSQVPDLLVIDEAHRVAACAHAASTVLRERYETVRALAHEAPRVLLLSATPVLHRQRDFLAMLHLLDPDTYKLEDLEWFEQRVAVREQVAQALLQLRPNRPASLLRRGLPDLRETFGADPLMLEHLAALEASFDAPDIDRERVLGDARAHVSESYRLHHRLLRNRRQAIAYDEYTVRGRDGLTIIIDPDPRHQKIDDWFADWRGTLLNDAIDKAGQEAAPDVLDSALATFRIYACYTTGDPSALADVVDFRLLLRKALAEAAGLDAEARATLKTIERSEAQNESLRELLADLTADHDQRGEWAAGIARVLIGLTPGVYVVFASAPATAEAIAVGLEEAGALVRRCTTNVDPEIRHAEVTEFSDGTGPRFLVCDAAGEEGLNLQVADAVVHLDLPCSVSRIEQRIGRVDRYGAGPPLRNIVITSGLPGGFADWWLRVLREAFHIFEQTTASTQYAIETVEQDLFRSVFESGTSDPGLTISEIEQRVTEQQERINRVDDLDALARQDRNDVDFVTEVVEAERQFADEFTLVTKALVDSNGETFVASGSAPQPATWDMTLVGDSVALQLFAGVVGIDHTVTTHRRIAVADRKVSLLRPGAPLVEALRIQQDADATAQIYADWYPQTADTEDLIALRCDFLIEADPSPAFVLWSALEAARPRNAGATRTDADAPLAIAALKRRVDAYLPTTLVTVWVDHTGNIIDQPSATTSGMIADPIAGLRAEQRRSLAQRLGAASLEDLLEVLSTSAQTAALESESTQSAVTTATTRARRDWEDAARVLRIRLQQDHTVTAQRDLTAEERVSAELLAALARPVARPIGAYLVVLTHEHPDEW